MHPDRGCPRWRNSWSQSVYAQGWQHGRASHFQKGHEQCEYCFCIFTCPVTGLHHCYGWWKIQSEAVWVACMTKMFFFFRNLHSAVWSTSCQFYCTVERLHPFEMSVVVNQLQTSASPLPFTIGGMYLVVPPNMKFLVCSSQGQEFGRSCRTAAPAILHLSPSQAVGSCGRHCIFRRIRRWTLSTANIGLLMPCCLAYSAILISILSLSTMPWRHTHDSWVTPTWCIQTTEPQKLMLLVTTKTSQIKINDVCV